MNERVYIEEADLPGLDIPDGWVVYRDDDGRIVLEPDESSPCAWPIEET